MANKLNPDLIGLTPQEKRKVGARKWQAENKEKYQEYQREYHRKYEQDPRKVATRLQRRFDEVQLIMARIQLKYDSMLAPYQNESAQLTTQIALNAEKIESGDLHYTPRNGVTHGN